MKKIGILSLGCSRNLVDSESILGRLRLKGCRITDIAKADIALINTCAFIEEAKQESIEAILGLIELKKKGQLKKIIVYGCLSQRYKDILRSQLPEVDAFVGKVSLNHEEKRFALTPRHFAYLKICEGCLNNCSFCVIPKIKGRFASLDIEAVLARVSSFDREKLAELNIIGQDITAYGIDLYARPALQELLKKIEARCKNIEWVRLLYLYPSRITTELLELIRDSEKICKYIDLPLQHINDRILGLMRRRTQRRQIFSLIEDARKIIPQVALRTSIIVGFPSETDKEFRQLLDFIKEVKFERLGAFIYSPEEGTQAYNFAKQVPLAIKKERFNRVMALQQKVSAGVNKNFLGKDIKVLIEGKKEDYYLGRSEFDAPEVDGIVFVKSKKALKPGDFVKVKISDTMEYDLTGEVVL